MVRKGRRFGSQTAAASVSSLAPCQGHPRRSIPTTTCTPANATRSCRSHAASPLGEQRAGGTRLRRCTTLRAEIHSPAREHRQRAQSVGAAHDHDSGLVAVRRRASAAPRLHAKQVQVQMRAGCLDA